MTRRKHHTLFLVAGIIISVIAALGVATAGVHGFHEWREYSNYNRLKWAVEKKDYYGALVAIMNTGDYRPYITPAGYSLADADALWGPISNIKINNKPEIIVSSPGDQEFIVGIETLDSPASRDSSDSRDSSLILDTTFSITFSTYYYGHEHDLSKKNLKRLQPIVKKSILLLIGRVYQARYGTYPPNYPLTSQELKQA
jgi:hypothetical protein